MSQTAKRGFHPIAAIRQSVSDLWREVAKFGVVGLSGLVIDVGLFNLLRFSGPDGQGPMYDRPISSKIISVAVATSFAYLGNRFWTFRHRGRGNMGREYLMFFGLNAIAMAIAVGCLWFSHYVMGWDSALADNISANVVGLGLGTLFRFWSYRKFVFPAIPNDPTHAAERELAQRDAASPI